MRRESRAKRNFCQTTANKFSGEKRTNSGREEWNEATVIKSAPAHDTKDASVRDHVPRTDICVAGGKAQRSARSCAS